MKLVCAFVQLVGLCLWVWFDWSKSCLFGCAAGSVIFSVFWAAYQFSNVLISNMLG
jgi:hypothetical protein